jgi:hypothetical protein
MNPFLEDISNYLNRRAEYYRGIGDLRKAEFAEKTLQALYNSPLNYEQRIENMRRSRAYTDLPGTFRKYIWEKFGIPKKYSDEKMRPLDKAMRKYVNTRGHSPGYEGDNVKKIDTVPHVNVIGRRGNMEGIEKIKELVDEYNRSLGDDGGIKWEFRNEFSDTNFFRSKPEGAPPGTTELVYWTMTGKQLPQYMLKPTDESIKKYNLGELQGSLTKLADHLSKGETPVA